MYIGDQYTRAVQNNIVLFLRIIILYIGIQAIVNMHLRRRGGKERARNYGGNTGVGIGGVGGGEGRTVYMYIHRYIYILTQQYNKHTLGGDEEERMEEGL